MKKLIFILLILFMASPCFAATYTAAAGGGNWNDVATWGGGGFPAAADDAVLNAGSGQVTVNVASACTNLTCTGYTNTLTLNASLTCSGNVILVSGMTFTPNAQDFIMTGASKTLTSGGRGFYNFRCQGTITNQDAMIVTNTFYLLVANSSFDANNQSIATKDVNMNSTNSGRTLTMGTGTWTISGDWDASNCTSARITYTVGTSTVVFTKNGANLYHTTNANTMFCNLTLPTSGTLNLMTTGYHFISGTMTGSTSTLSGANGTTPQVFLLKATTPLSGTFTFVEVGTADCRISFRSVGDYNLSARDYGSWDLSFEASGAGDRVYTMTGDITTTGNVTLMGIANQTVTLSAGANSLTAGNLYMGYSATQGGVFSAGSGTSTISGNVSRRAGQTSTNNGVNTGTGTIYIGGVYTATGITMTGTGTVVLLGAGTPLVMDTDDLTCLTLAFAPATNGATTIPTGTYNCSNLAIIPQANNTTFNLGGSITLNAATNKFTIAAISSITGGVVNINAYNVSCYDFIWGMTGGYCNSSSMTANLTTGTITASHSWYATDIGGAGAYTCAFNCSGGNVIVQGNGALAAFATRSSDALTTVTVTDTGTTWKLADSGNLIVYTAQSFFNITVAPTAARTLICWPALTFTVTNALTLTGSSGNLITLASFVPGTRWGISLTGASQSIKYVAVSDSDASGGNMLIALGETDNGNNLNWLFGAGGGLLTMGAGG